MKKKLMIRAAVGFLFGIAAMYLVPSLINRTPIGRLIYTDELLTFAGSPEAAVALTILVMGLFGSLCLGGTLFYEIENWSLAKATAAHYLSISLGYLIPNWVLCWNMPPKLFLVIEAFMTIGFFLVWLTMYLYYRRKVRELNDLLYERKKKGAKTNDETDADRKEK